MTITDVIILAVVACIIALMFIAKTRKKNKCTGCPYANACEKATSYNCCKQNYKRG
jgi:hypothetical protein